VHDGGAKGGLSTKKGERPARCQASNEGSNDVLEKSLKIVSRFSGYSKASRRTTVVLVGIVEKGR
jgi:hypothetical protein